MEAELDALSAALQRTRSAAGAARRLAADAPWLFAQLVVLREDPAALAPWGLSRNRDDNVHATIVAPAVLRALTAVTGHPLPDDICHAGLLHSYGYLLSTLPTPYGLKRDRWLRPTIERGLGLRRPVLRPRPHAGTLLANLTWMLGHIAWREQPRELRRLAPLRGRVAPELLDYPFAELRITRVIETVRLPGRGTLRMHSDVVAFRSSRPGAQPRNALLVHSLAGSAISAPLLQTCFPVTAATAAGLLAPTSAGRVPDLRPRYNTVVDGFDAPRPGHREIRDHA